jgi:hypothetical protein
MPQNSGHTWTGNEDNRFIILWHNGNGGSWNSPRHDAELCWTHGLCPGAGVETIHSRLDTDFVKGGKIGCNGTVIK